MHEEHCVTGHWREKFSGAGLRDWVEELRGKLRAPQVSLALVFMTPRYFENAAEILEIVRVHGHAPLLAGCSSGSLIAGEEEIEENAGLVVSLLWLPEADLKAFRFTQAQVEEANGPGYWQMETGLGNEDTNGWLVFADPFHFDPEAWLRTWNEAYAPLPVVGGLASGDRATQQTQVYLNGDVFEEGGVAISVGGGVKLAGVISQGCTPIGETWTLTKVERNLIVQIANRPAYEVLAETFNALPVRDQRKAQRNLFIGLVMNEYQEDFHRGDFLVRNLLAADPASGVIAVGGLPRQGQTMQFQRRDAEAATEDMRALLDHAKKELAGAKVYGGCLCSCNGRGRGLFGFENHDAKMVQQKLGPLGVAGFFCNGEIGPVGNRNFLHGYTASLALFVEHTTPSAD